MTGPQFKKALEDRCISQRSFAIMVGVNERTVRRWVSEGPPKIAELALPVCSTHASMGRGNLPVSQIAKGYEQAKLYMRKEISHKEAHSRILSGLPTIVEETRNDIGHPVFRYFISNQE